MSVQNERSLAYYYNFRQRKSLNKCQNILWKNCILLKKCDFPHILIVCEIT